MIWFVETSEDFFAFKSMHDHSFSLTMVDDFTKCTCVYVMKSNAEVWPLLKKFFALAEYQFQTTIKIVRTDNCLGFNINDFLLLRCHLPMFLCWFLSSKWWHRTKTPTYLNVARSISCQAHLPPKFFGRLHINDSYLISRIPTPNYRGEVF